MAIEGGAYEVPRAELAFTIHVQVGALEQIGPVPGGAARVIPITGGTFEGPRLRGEVIPGGADWQLTRPDGVTELRAHYGLKCDDGTIVQVNNRCLVVRTEAGARLIRSVLTLEAPEGPHDWLNKAVFVGTLNAPGDEAAPVVIRAFQIV
ncbi:DUF3237 domain-containing protein [Phenylobacterium terrae]|uniref:UPF0311 protein ACFSC0_00730 n=1 Tax=Phenylobacterium terrae TaxID=2665495 RepID=A0ABW4MVJ9_9CAUL